MEKKLIKMPSIEQFASTVQTILRRVNFVGFDENGDAIYDPSIPKPTITFTGTVKAHGTNASVAYNNHDGMWCQSKAKIITPEQDNAGFAFFVESKKECFEEIIKDISMNNDIDLNENTITVYGEWCGGNIQKNVAINGLDKMFLLFGIKVTPFDTEETSYWIDSKGYEYFPDETRIYNIENFGTFKVDVDLNNPKMSQNKIHDLTEFVEDECPIGKYFGISGTGEGIVWVAEYNGDRYRFKSKGEKHAGKSKVKTIKKVDNERLQLIIDTADKVTPVWRLEQMLEETCDFMNGGEMDRSKLGDFIRLVINDIMKEDLHIINDAGLEPKDINKRVSEVARMYFFEQEKERVGL